MSEVLLGAGIPTICLLLSSEKNDDVSSLLLASCNKGISIGRLFVASLAYGQAAHDASAGVYL